jgi:hypothetical protein
VELLRHVRFDLRCLPRHVRRDGRRRVLAFPFVGLALIPVFLVGLLAVIGFGYRFASRGPEGLPERTTSPGEPEELGRPR